jgi:putative transcriptional regulator
MAVVKITPELVAKALGATDWQALDAQTDEDIAGNVANDPDAAPIEETIPLATADVSAG